MSCSLDALRARICKRLRSPGIHSEDSIPPAYVAWRSGKTNRVVAPTCQAGNRFLGSLKVKRFTNTGSDEKGQQGNYVSQALIFICQKILSQGHTIIDPIIGFLKLARSTIEKYGFSLVIPI
jgi:hypothetical protein